MHPESTPTWLVGPEIPPTQRIGTILSGSYRLDAFLGQGMTGITYNAWHLRQKQPYAVKLLHRELQPTHERVLRLRTDLRVLSGLRRQGFLPVELSFAPDGAPFLASELLIGETLRERLARGPLPSLAAGIVIAALARALEEAHRHGVVHGDLRPENVLLPSEAGREVEAGQPVLLDAALHHLRRRPIGLDESLPLDKLAYLPPEQTSGEQDSADAAGDMFALGAILYECLTGKSAFYADELEVVYEKLSQPPAKLVLPREVGAPPGLAEALDEVIARACARVPADRYPDMGVLLEALSDAYKRVGLPLPPADERVAIDTVLLQNRGLRKRTVAVKKVSAGTSATTEAIAGATASGRIAGDAAGGKAASTDMAKPVLPAESAKAEEPARTTQTPRPGLAAHRATPVPSAETPKRAQQRSTPPAAAAPASYRRATPAPGSFGQGSTSRVTPAPRQPTPVPAVPSGTVRKQTPPLGLYSESSKVMPAPTATEPKKKTESTTAKHRAVRRTVKARDLGRLLAEIAAGRLDPTQAMAMAAGQEDLPESEAPAEPTEQERIIAEGRAAVLARAEAAKKNRQAEADERMQRAQEQQRRLLEQARQETLARMRAEMADSRQPGKSSSKDGEDKAPQADSELLAEAERQRHSLEAERQEAERQAALEAQRASDEAAAAELARNEAGRAAAALRDAEQREAARAEAMRVQTEREAEARRLAEQAEADRQRQVEAAEAAALLADEARAWASEAAEAAALARSEAEREAEMLDWEDGLVEVVDRKRPPPKPPASLRHKSEKALQAAADAAHAEQRAEQAALRVEQARLQAAAIAHAAQEARFAVTAAENARAREAEELAEAVASAEAARARDQELLQLAAAASERATAAESARQRHVVRVTRVTQALAVLKQVQDMAQQEPTPPAIAPAADAAAGVRGPSGALAVNSPATSTPAAAGAAAQGALRPEPSGIYAGYTLGDALREASGGLKTSPMVNTGSRPEFTGPYAPAQITPAVEQATQSPTRPMQVIPLTGQEPSEVVEISAMLPGSAMPVPNSKPGISSSMPATGGQIGSTSMPSISGSISVPAMPSPGGKADTRQMAMPQLIPASPPGESSDFTFTVGQFVVTVIVISLLSAIIGALIALLVMQRNQPTMPPTIERPMMPSKMPGEELLPGPAPAPPVSTPPVAVAPSTDTTGNRPATALLPSSPPDLASAVLEGPPPINVAPPPPSAAPVPAIPSRLRPATVKLPPLRLSTDLPVLKPRLPVPLVRPGAAPASAQPTTSAGEVKPLGPAASEGKSGGDNKPHDEPPVEPKAPEAKPAGEPKEAAKPKPAAPPTPTTGEDGLRNPFGP